MRISYPLQKCSNNHRNLPIKVFVSNLLENDKENRRVAAEEIGRGILRGKKRMDEQPENRLQAHEKSKHPAPWDASFNPEARESRKLQAREGMSYDDKRSAVNDSGEDDVDVGARLAYQTSSIYLYRPQIEMEEQPSLIQKNDTFSATMETTTEDTVSYEYDPNLINEYGWVQVADGIYNVDANILLEKHSFDQEED
ncbi:hypothetical protein INT45_006501 [Circinella minor]|uniref:Uncharacterized protein n=1 Tax=Circinella minor TaxID=1195481 RepID=A0A8H7S2H0_9FUNG|nr:hypothetical protein INT45_006501 [Circinella minor]